MINFNKTAIDALLDSRFTDAAIAVKAINPNSTPDSRAHAINCMINHLAITNQN